MEQSEEPARVPKLCQGKIFLTIFMVEVWAFPKSAVVVKKHIRLNKGQP